MEIDVNVLTNWWSNILSILGILASFLVAGIALWLGLRTNRQLHKIRRLEKQENFVKEIIDWAADITRFISEQIVTDRTNASIISRGTANRLKELNVLAVKGVYIESLAGRLFPNNTDLHKDIHNFRGGIDKHTRLLTLVVNGKVINGEKATGIHGVRLRDNALNLIRFATGIYTEIK